jgi:hypothetical protein
MNYDLIIKLAKLANNNPNDNEANQAARKVCRLLAEANFNFPAHNGDNSRRRPYTPPPPEPDIWSDFYDIFNEAQRQNERQAEYERRAKEAEEARKRQKQYEEANRAAEERRKKNKENADRDRQYYEGNRPYEPGTSDNDWSEDAERKRTAEAKKREEDIEREQREKAKSDRERAKRDKDFQEKWVKYGGVRPPWAE